MVKHLQQVLRHVHDYAYLERHPLTAQMFPLAPADSLTAAQQMRRLILQLLEDLDRPGGDRSTPRGWTGYYVLAKHYVEERDPEEIMVELAISERQFYREQRKAIETLARTLLLKLEEQSSAANTVNARENRTQQTIRSEATRLAPESQWIDMRTVLCDVLDTVIAPLAASRSIELTRRVPQGPMWVLASRTVVRQIFVQVLSRFALHSAASWVLAELRSAPRQVQVEISADTAELPQSPDATGQAHAAPQPNYAALRSLVEVVNGTWEGVEATASLVRLRFALPADQRYLLAIEDNESAFRLLQRLLAQPGFRVVNAPDGQTALNLLSEHLPDLVLLDVMLPGQDGWEILKALRADPRARTVPVVVTSVLDVRDAALALGADWYLRKPFSQAELLEVLNRVGARVAQANRTTG